MVHEQGVLKTTSAEGGKNDQAAGRGDPADLGLLLARLAFRFARISRGLGIDAQVTEDLVQTTAVRFLAPGRRVTWPAANLLRTFRNECLRYLRQRDLSRERKLDLASIEAARSSPRTASGELLAREVDEAVLELGPRQQLVLTCRYLEELPEDEIATRLSLRPSSVKNAVSRALAALRKKLAGSAGLKPQR